MTSARRQWPHDEHVAPVSGYEGQPARVNQPKGRINRLSASLWALAAVLGAIIFGVDLGSPGALGYPVRLCVLATVVAAVGLLPGQAVRGWIVVALAVTGFVDAAAIWIKAGEPDWALAVIVILDALQSIVAVVALLHEARTSGSVESDRAYDYGTYARLVQAYQAYAAQYQQSAPTQYDATARASAQAQAQAAAGAAGARATTAQESFGELQARYARHGVGAPASRSGGSVADAPAGRVADPGVSGAKHKVPESHPYGDRVKNAGRSVIEPPGP